MGILTTLLGRSHGVLIIQNDLCVRVCVPFVLFWYFCLSDFLSACLSVLTFIFCSFFLLFSF